MIASQSDAARRWNVPTGTDRVLSKFTEPAVSSGLFSANHLFFERVDVKNGRSDRPENWHRASSHHCRQNVATDFLISD